jgi:hypothetical protein
MQRVAKRVLKGCHSARVPKASPEEPLFQWEGQRDIPYVDVY